MSCLDSQFDRFAVTRRNRAATGAATVGEIAYTSSAGPERGRSGKFLSSGTSSSHRRSRDSDDRTSETSNLDANARCRPKENTLSGILQRLNNIEQLLSSGEAGSQSGEDGSPPMNLQINPATRTQVADSSLNVDRNSASSIHQMLTEATITTLGAFENNLACSVNALSKRLTVTTLNNALSNIETFKSSRRRSLHEYTSSPIHPDTARQWIRSCFAYMRQDGFIGLIDQRLILSIPDLALSPGVDIDPTALLCYHSLVLLGEMLDPNAQSKEPQHRRKELYFDCLKHVEAWEQHGSKTQLDMIVSGLLVSPSLLD